MDSQDIQQALIAWGGLLALLVPGGLIGATIYWFIGVRTRAGTGQLSQATARAEERNAN